MENPIWTIEAHLWFENFDEYVEIPGASFDHKDEKKIDALISFCGKENVDLVARVSRDTSRRVGYLRGKRRQDE